MEWDMCTLEAKILMAMLEFYSSQVEKVWQVSNWGIQASELMHLISMLNCPATVFSSDHIVERIMPKEIDIVMVMQYSMYIYVYNY